MLPKLAHRTCIRREALDVGQAWEEAEEVSAASGAVAAAALRVHTGDANHQQHRDA